MPSIKPDLLSLIEEEESQALGPGNGQLAIERATALSYYLGEPFGNEVDGRSQVVSHDVADTVEWIKPSLLRIFMSGDRVVSFDPHGPEDEEQADQETDYVNYLITQKNNGFNVFYVWFTDALLSKNGYVKACWEEYEDQAKERYENLTEEEYLMILQDDTVEVLEHTEDIQVVAAMMPMGPVQQQVITHSLVLQRKRTVGQLKIYNVAPEHILVSANHSEVCLQNAPFVEHVEWKTLSALREDGYDIPDDLMGDDTEELEEVERREFQDSLRTDSADPSMRVVKVREAYIRSDQDGDGIAELRRVVVVGKTILDDEEVDIIPLAAISPTMLPHRHIGRSVADDVMDLQLIKSTIMRQLFDNMYIANNVSYAVSDKVNLDDMLVSRPGRVVRMENGATPDGHILPLQAVQLGQESYGLLEYIDTIKSERTGVTKYNQGLDANSLNKTYGGISQIMSAAQQRLEMIARVFAETGVKELFSIVHSIVLKHAKKKEIVKLRNKWVPVDPREWVKRTDMTISVGLGNGNKDQMLGHLTTILQAQAQFAQMGVVRPHNVFNALEKLAQNSGFKSPEEFFTDPDKTPQPQQPHQDPAVIKAQADAQRQQMTTAADIQAQQATTQASIDAMLRKAEADIQTKWQKAMADIEIARQKAMADMQNGAMAVG